MNEREIPKLGPIAGLQIAPQSPQDIARFWAKVDKNGPGGCWIWKSAVLRFGYGAFWAAGKNHRAHRYAMAIMGYPLVPGWSVDHLCKNRLCVTWMPPILGTSDPIYHHS